MEVYLIRKKSSRESDTRNDEILREKLSSRIEKVSARISLPRESIVRREEAPRQVASSHVMLERKTIRKEMRLSKKLWRASFIFPKRMGSADTTIVVRQRQRGAARTIEYVNTTRFPRDIHLRGAVCICTVPTLILDRSDSFFRSGKRKLKHSTWHTSPRN